MDDASHVISRTRISVRRFFDELASRWDSIIDSGHEARLDVLLNGIRWSLPVLDAGSGTGVMWGVLRRAGVPLNEVVAMDISTRMLACARPERPARVAADAHRMPFRGATFGTVICNSCLPHFDELPRALREIARVIRPGGALVVCHSEPREVINRHHRDTGGVVGGHELPEPAELGRMLKDIGMQPEILRDSPGGYLVTAGKK